ncbi:hypothetical protein LTR62_005555 [Meristemomyces frigidus]|uniref:Uncharacterized protein n=1 Tax=Meristemomyces frigidus TaxID=1508187 RepID=A0AAN7TFA8_9PEZI|nr:hypothetical protein LTR62_005555 [Meristemomyces frigidus]
MAFKLDAATAVRQVDAHTYEGEFRNGWTIGTVPHGGYVSACVQQVIRLHFDTTLRKQNQPHTMALHLDFLRRTELGPTLFKVKDVKIGRQTSVVHVTLSQGDREEVVGYITNTNLDTEAGYSVPTDWVMHPEAPPVDISKLDSDTDKVWGERKLWPFSDFRVATQRIRAWFPRKGQHSKALVDQWLALREPDDRWTNDKLGYVVDTFPQILENYLLAPLDPYSVEFEREHGVDEQNKLMQGKAKMWYPTVLLNLEVKKALPTAGVKFLFVRLQAKMIRNGRYDLELIVKDAEGDLVALSHHVCLAVSSERNTAARRKVDKDASKL